MTEPQYRRTAAIEMANSQREISVSEFFLKNRHLLGFDTPSKALVTAIKEAVDNALDACEEVDIVPAILVEIHERSGKVRVVVEDNGPGIVESQIARIFGKLLYGSKFHKLSQSRGQQGMGISAAGMYAQLTAGRPLHIISRVAGEELASEMFVSIDTASNRPDIHRKRHIVWDRPHGTRVEMEMEGHYQKGPHSVEVYLKQTAVANPHVSIYFVGPRGQRLKFDRSSAQNPPRPTEIKPHPYGVELGRLIQLLSNSKSGNLLRFLSDEFSCIGRKTALQIIDNAGKPLSAKSYPAHIARTQATALHHALQRTRIRAPRTDCIVPIGEERLLEGLRKEIDAQFYTATTRPAAAYRGNPFQIEVALAFGNAGGETIATDTARHLHKATGHDSDIGHEFIMSMNEPVRLLRFGNRVPLLFQQSSCAITKSVAQVDWRSYGLRQQKGSLPIAPMSILIHVASVWVPYTSESKEAIAPYPEIVKEIRLGLQQCARRLAVHLRQQTRLRQEYERRGYIEKYLPHIGIALQEILSLSDQDRDRTVEKLDDVLLTSRSYIGKHHEEG